MGVLGYGLRAFGYGVASPVLESLWAPAVPVMASIPAIALSVVAAYPRRWRAGSPGASGVADLARWMRGARPWTALAGPSLAVVASGISLGLRTPASLVASLLAADYSRVTTAGRVLFRGVAVSQTPALALPLLALAFSLLSAVLVAVSIAARRFAEEAELVRPLPRAGFK